MGVLVSVHTQLCRDVSVLTIPLLINTARVFLGALVQNLSVNLQNAALMPGAWEQGPFG